MKIKSIGNFAVVDKIAGDKLSAVASTAAVDRDGEVILPSAFLKHLDAYRKNPVILAAHTHRSLDGTPTIIGSATRIEVKDNALEFDMTFAGTTVGLEWKKLFDEGHARAFSIGFIPRTGAFDKERAAWVWTEVELIEISAVPVPANPEALARRGLDGGETPAPETRAPVDREQLARDVEALRGEFGRTPADQENFNTIASAVREGIVPPAAAEDLLRKAARQRDEREECGERDLAKAIEELLKSAGGK